MGTSARFARTRAILALMILALAISPIAAPSALAQAPPTPADASTAAFLALPEPTRKGVQDALVWLGFYNGVVDGAFGARTRDAILAFQASLKAPADGALSPAEVQALLALAQKARDAVGFQVVTDAKTGAKIGAPTKLLGPRAAARLDFASSVDPDLGALYARLSAGTPSRKISYKAMKPDAFFVVSGQDGATNFYSRFEKDATATPPIRGFTFAYPTVQAPQLNRIAIAVANSFEAFPGSSATLAANQTQGQSVPPASPEPAATALIVAPGKALTALKAADCASPTVNGKPVRLEQTDAATGLALIAGDFSSKSDAPRFGAPAPDLVVLGFAGSRVAASSAALTGDPARPFVVAAIERGAGGGPVFDRRGALVGLVAPIAGEPKRFGTVALAAPHALIASDAVRAFLGSGEPAAASAATLSAGDIAAHEKNALVAVYCGT